jgi:hypothetical protein
MTIIGLAGRKQSGKSTACEFISSIIKEFTPHLSSKVYSFADPLKTDICINILGLTYDQCYGTDDDKNTLTSLRWKDMPEYNITWTWNDEYDDSGYMTARQVMEFVGTSIFRKMKNNVWSESTIKKIHLDNIDVALVADCRFPNEVEAIQNAGGVVIRLTRDLYKSKSESESALDYPFFDWSKFDYVLDNADITTEEKNSLIKQFLINKGIIQL